MTSYANPHPGLNASHNSKGQPQHFIQHPGPIVSHHQQHASALRRHVSRHQFAAELSQCLFDFVVQLLPTAEELAVKEDVRKLLERLIRTIEPDSRLLSFGSTANGFSLRNSDMDLCCLIDSNERLAATDLVTMLGDLLERETKFNVKPLPHARIPIVKLSLDPSPGLPHGIACDIGFENRLALENTRLLMCYAMVDPKRVRTMVLFLKVWSKRRKINSPYKGTLSSYGYVLLVIYFLVHVKNPPVLPNLQQIPPLRPIPREEYYLGENNVWFFDDIDVLRQRWQSSNNETVAELLIDFFRYYARDFSYNTGVASIRAGLLKKDSKGWLNDLDARPYQDSRERNRLCIEDPFETDYNVSRCVTKDGLYTIRGEFMRASRILQNRPERAIVALAQLCEERKDEELIRAVPSSKSFVPPRLSIPPQTPYAVGSSSLRPKGDTEGDRLSPPRRFFEQGLSPQIPQNVPSYDPADHMAPKRAKWTSPPPPEAPSADHTSFEDRLGLGLSLATSSSDAREQERAYLSSSSNSEVLTDDEHPSSDIAPDDDVRSVRSFTDESSSMARLEAYAIGPSSALRLTKRSVDDIPGTQFRGSPVTPDFRLDDNATPTYSDGRGRRPTRQLSDSQPGSPPVSFPKRANDFYRLGPPAKTDSLRRSTSGPARTSIASRIPSSLISPTIPAPTAISPSARVYYETTSPIHSDRGIISYPTPQSPLNPFPLYQQQYYFPPGRPHADTAESSATLISNRHASKVAAGVKGSATPAFPSYPQSTHSHTHSSSTIIAPTTPSASMVRFAPPTPPSEPSSPTPSPHVPYIQSIQDPHTSCRLSFGSASPSTSVSVESTSPTSTNSSPSYSGGYISPVSSNSPRSTDFGSPTSQSPPSEADHLDPRSRYRRKDHFAGIGVLTPANVISAVKKPEAVTAQERGQSLVETKAIKRVDFTES